MKPANFPATQKVISQAEAQKSNPKRFESCLYYVENLLKNSKKQIQDQGVSQADRAKMAEDIEILEQYLADNKQANA